MPIEPQTQCHAQISPSIHEYLPTTPLGLDKQCSIAKCTTPNDRSIDGMALRAVPNQIVCNFIPDYIYTDARARRHLFRWPHICAQLYIPDLKKDCWSYKTIWKRISHLSECDNYAYLKLTVTDGSDCRTIYGDGWDGWVSKCECGNPFTAPSRKTTKIDIHISFVRALAIADILYMVIVVGRCCCGNRKVRWFDSDCTHARMHCGVWCLAYVIWNTRARIYLHLLRGRFWINHSIMRCRAQPVDRLDVCAVALRRPRF